MVAINGKNAIVGFILLALPESAGPRRLGAVAMEIRDDVQVINSNYQTAAVKSTEGMKSARVSRDDEDYERDIEESPSKV